MKWKYNFLLLLFFFSIKSPAFGKASVTGFMGNIEEITKANKSFRKVIYTGKKLQLVLMTLKPGEEIGLEMHKDTDQFFRIESGKGEVLINGKKSSIRENDSIFVPSGSKHNITNTGNSPLQLYTLYGPPNHKDQIIHETKQQAAESKKEDKFDGKTTE